MMDTRRRFRGVKQEPLGKWQIKVFILCWVAYASIYFGRVNLSISIPEIQQALEWSKGDVGLIGTLFFWIYGIGQLVNGSIGDRVSSKTFIFIGLLGTGIVNLLFGLSSGYGLMLILWSCNGYFQSIVWGPIAKTLTYWFSYEKRGQVAIWISTSMIGGYLLSWGFLGKVLDILSWRWGFIIPGLSIVAYSFIWNRSIKDHPKDVGLASPNGCISLSMDSQQRSHSEISLWRLLTETKLWFIVVACFSQGIIKEGISLWGPTMLKETYYMDMDSIIGVILLIPIMNFGGMMVTNSLNKKIGNEKVASIILFIVGLLSVVCLYVFGHVNVFLGIVFLSISSAMMYGVNTLLLGVIPMNYAKYNKVSSVAGFLNFCSYLAAGLASYVTGFMVDSAGWGGVLVTWIICCILGVIALLMSL